MSKRLLVTGAAGFVGHHFVEHVLRTEPKWEIVAPVSFRHRGCPLRLLHLQGNSALQIVRVELDAPISSRVSHALGEVTDIVNFASESHVDRSIADPRPFILNNVELMMSLLEFAKSRPIESFVHMSTDEVYGPAPVGHRHVEWEAILPSNPYSASKASQEALAISWWRTYGVPVSIVNSMNLIGERQDAEKFVPTIIRHVHKGSPIPIYGDNASSVGSRMYLHARSLANAMVWLLKRPVSRYPVVDRPDRWHVVGEQEINNLELAKLIASQLGVQNPAFDFLPEGHARPGHDRRYALNGAKIDAHGWKQPMNFELSLRKTVEWTVEHPAWLVP